MSSVRGRLLLFLDRARLAVSSLYAKLSEAAAGTSLRKADMREVSSSQPTLVKRTNKRISQDVSRTLFNNVGMLSSLLSVENK